MINEIIINYSVFITSKSDNYNLMTGLPTLHKITS